MQLKNWLRPLPFIILSIFNCINLVYSGCQNHCSGNGRCNRFSSCDCFEGYAGNDCSKKLCPVGPIYASVPSDSYTAHPDMECSGQGDCDYSTGLCKCYTGYTGLSCEKTGCINSCSGHGSCISLQTAAMDYDGYALNRTTRYDAWEANKIYGCKCDYGWIGVDCAQKSCEYGIDPRLSDQPHEIVTLVCACPGGACTGKFKLRIFDYPIYKWLTPSSTIYDLLSALSTLPGIYQNSSVLAYPSVVTLNRFENQTLCNRGQTTKTKIKFRRNYGNLPPISFYANLIRYGSAYFETKETITCDCLHHGCNGTFRVSFDGEMSPLIEGYSNGSVVISSLQAMQTVQAAGYTVLSKENASYPLCAAGAIRNLTVVFRGQSGNAPMIGLWSSMITTHGPSPTSYYTTTNTSNVLRITTQDGRDEHVKLCNGIGACDFSKGVCTCPYGWTFDATLGACGLLQVNTSRFNGIARCPGVIDSASIGSSSKTSYDNKANYNTLVYMAMNPSDPAAYSKIYSFQWQPTSIKGARILPATASLFTTLSSAKSAGPLVLDQAKDHLIYVDNNPTGARYIYIANQFDSTNYTIFGGFGYTIHALSFDAYFKRRKLYWSVPMYNDIYFASVDIYPPVIHSVKGLMDNSGNLHSPYGLAIHYVNNRLYWIDRNITGVDIHGHHVHAALRSVSLVDYSHYEERFIFTQTADKKYNISTNVTDLILDFSFNNTAFFIDSSPSGHPGIYSVNLEHAIEYNSSSLYTSLFLYYQSPRLVINSIGNVGIYPRSLLLDANNYYILWTDDTLGTVGYARYKTQVDDTFSPGTAYSDQTNLPMYMVMDYGLGKPQFASYDCYGNGKCLGLEGNFVCECYEGYSGDCQVRECPKGPAWYSEPIVDDIAHDVYVECSNRGVCDRTSGLCTCQYGFEGQACERLSCVGDNSTGILCNGAGRCLSLREMGYYHKNDYQEPEPIVYGPQAKDPRTWDADMIFGCYADEYGYYDNATVQIMNRDGPQLATYTCPKGFNSRHVENDIYHTNKTGNFTNLHEIQQLSCEAHHGTFQLQFRGFVTAPISATIDVHSFISILQALPSMGPIQVTFSHATLCSDYESDYTATIVFGGLVDHAVPLLQVVNNTLRGLSNTVTVTRLQAVSWEDAVECSGHGTCDTTTGVCNCWEGYGSSDGAGNAGKRGDCGYIMN